MAESKAERVLSALVAVLGHALPANVVLVRNEALPARIPDAGWVCLRDGDPGQPEVLLSPLTWLYEHRAEIDIIVDPSDGQRDAAFDWLKRAVGTAIAADRTLGGLCDYVAAEAPAAVDLVLEGHALKAATIIVVLHYATMDPLA